METISASTVASDASATRNMVGRLDAICGNHLLTNSRKSGIIIVAGSAVVVTPATSEYRHKRRH